MSSLIDRILKNPLRNNIGIDLGTSNTVAFLAGKGVIMNEPTLVTLNEKTGQITCLGKKSYRMIGRVPSNLKIIHPLKDGVISDYEITEQLLAHIFRIAQDKSPKILGPNVIIGVPCEITNVERKGLIDAAKDAGASNVELIQEPLAAMIGLNLNLKSEEVITVIDMGCGTTDILISGKGGIIESKTIKMAGDKLCETLMQSIFKKTSIQIGERTAEDLKTTLMQGSAEKDEFSIRGRDATTGLPKEIKIKGEEVDEYLIEDLEEIIRGLANIIERLPVEVLADMKKKGVYFVGGGTQIKGLQKLMEKRLNIKITIPNNPIVAVAKGTAIMSLNPKKFESFFIKESDE